MRVYYRDRMNVYIDIDGPLIRDAKPTPNCFEFLRWAYKGSSPLLADHARCSRLACWNPARLRHAIGCPELPSEIDALLRAIKPTEWSGTKISRIDLASDFIWIDDDPLQVEIDALRERGLLHRLLIVDSDDDLLRATW